MGTCVFVVLAQCLRGRTSTWTWHTSVGLSPQRRASSLRDGNLSSGHSPGTCHGTVGQLCLCISRLGTVTVSPVAAAQYGSGLNWGGGASPTALDRDTGREHGCRSTPELFLVGPCVGCRTCPCTRSPQGGGVQRGRRPLHTARSTRSQGLARSAAALAC